MRFRPEQHLRRQGDIRAVREGGRRIDCRAFTVWWKSRGTRSSLGVDDPVAGKVPRVCVIASGAAVGAATLRNRAKRRLREVFRHQQHRVPSTCDILLIARKAATTCPIGDMEQKFAEACRHMDAGGRIAGEGS